MECVLVESERLCGWFVYECLGMTRRVKTCEWREERGGAG